jgi:hypothetical protein
LRQLGSCYQVYRLHCEPAVSHQVHARNAAPKQAMLLVPMLFPDRFPPGLPAIHAGLGASSSALSAWNIPADWGLRAVARGP